MSPNERRILWTTSASHALIHVFELAVPALLLPIQAEFGAGDLAMGKVVTLYGLLFGVGSLPAGALVDRLGSKALVVLCLWGASASIVGMAVAPSLSAFALCAGAMGLFLSIYHPAGTALLTHALPLSGRVFATHGMLGNLGVAGSSVIAASLGALFGWRWGLGLLGIVGAVVGMAALTLPTPPVHELRQRTGQEGRWPAFVLLLVAAGFLGMVYRGVTTFLPKFFSTSLGTGAGGADLALGGLLTTIALLTGIAGMYSAGKLIDRGVGAPRAFLIGTAVQMPFLVLLGYAGGLTLVPLAMAVAFFHFFTQPPGNHMVADFTPPRLRGLGYGIYFFFVFGMGSVGATLGGWISEGVGIASTFPALATLLAPALVVVLILQAVAVRSSGSASASES